MVPRASAGTSRAGRLVVLAVLVPLGVTACGASSSPVAAKLGGQTIGRDALTAEVTAIQQAASAPASAGADSGTATAGGSPSGPSADDEALVARVLMRQLESKVVHAEVTDRKLHIDSSAVAAGELDARTVTDRDEPGTWARLPAWYQRELGRRAAEVAALQVDLSGTPITDDAMRAEYQQNLHSSFTVNCVRHVLVPNEVAAQQVEARLAAGDDFATVARDQSTDAGTAGKGGELGCTTAVQAGYDPALQRAIDTQAVGAPGPAFQAPAGWEVVEVTSRQVRTFDEAREAVRLTLLSASASRVRDLVAVRLRTTPVWVDARYGTFDPASPVLGVRPPHADAGARTVIPGLNPVAPPGGNSGEQQPEPFD
jgi:hypothetical protein